MRAALTPDALRSVYDRAARRYDRWHALATLRSDERGRRALVERCVRAGDRVLDAGGGTGLTARLATDAVGPGGRVTLVDLSRGMLKEAARRFRGSAVQGRVSLLSGDMHRLPFEDGRFDAVLSTYSVCPLTDPAQGAAELYRVLKPGGLLGVAHSSEPANPVMRWVAARVESLVWRVPRLSLGCRPVEVLPRLVGLGAEVVHEERIGVPLWPFRVVVVRRAG